MSDKVKMSKLERQLKLYEVLLPYAIAQFSEICQVYPYNKRLLQRDLADLKAAGLVAVKYSRKGKGYVKTGIPDFEEDVPPKRKMYLKKLDRLGRLLSELVNEDQEEGDPQGCVTAKVCYDTLFPGLSERTRQRDFAILRKLGHQIFYDHVDHCFSYNEDDFRLGWVDAPKKIDDAYLDGVW
ncbi:MAG: hypothetical protein HFG22_04465 [Lachnospiraceae bacterium]|nr:hypothetical protein [Lachnospiraceae bacterium]